MTIAYVMECVGRGLLTEDQTGGFLPRFGSAGDMLRAVEMIAHGEGFGAQMGQGSKRLAAWLGGDAADYTVEVKGQELPMHEPRSKHALGVGYAVAPVGKEGPLAGMEITDEAFLHARNHWYGLMGWSEVGVPTEERLASLGLEEILSGIEVIAA